MAVQIISTRYTVNYRKLYSCLVERFGSGQVKVTEMNDGQNWKLEIPQELTTNELIEVMRKCQERS